MKKLFLFLLLVSSLSLTAQDNKSTASQPNGFWVIENNIKTPKESTVYFYNNSQQLIYKEKISGKRLNVNRQKVVRHLNNVLDQSLLAWNKEQTLRENLQLVWNKR